MQMTDKLHDLLQCVFLTPDLQTSRFELLSEKLPYMQGVICVDGLIDVVITK